MPDLDPGGRRGPEDLHAVPFRGHIDLEDPVLGLVDTAAQAFQFLPEEVFVPLDLELEKAVVDRPEVLELPWAATFPLFRMTTSEQMVSMSARMWEEIRTWISLAEEMSLMSSRTSCRPCGSRFAVGSSRKRSFGSWTRAWASLSRCFIPAE